MLGSARQPPGRRVGGSDEQSFVSYARCVDMMRPRGKPPVTAAGTAAGTRMGFGSGRGPQILMSVIMIRHQMDRTGRRSAPP